jgi:hypothetical protein
MKTSILFMLEQVNQQRTGFLDVLAPFSRAHTALSLSRAQRRESNDHKLLVKGGRRLTERMINYIWASVADLASVAGCAPQSAACNGARLIEKTGNITSVQRRLGIKTLNAWKDYI